MAKKFSPKTGAAGAIIAAAFVAAALTGCGDSKPVGTIGYVKGFGGLVAADEPRAVLAARDVLSAGGNAADAAVTLYFSLAVTLPSTASLGGGGTCVVHDRAKNLTEVLDFQTPPATTASVLPSAVPTNARGLWALQAKYGKLRWESLLAEPERMARIGTPVSRALANDLAMAAPRLAADPEARRLYFRNDGRVLGEGDRLTNFDLGGVFASLRRAPGDFYNGQMAQKLASSANSIGAGLTAQDLADVRPQFVAGSRQAIGLDVAVTLAALSDLGRGSKRAANQADAGPAASYGAGGTGFVVMDSYGGAVACTVTANGLFGTGRMIPGTGMFLAAQPERSGFTAMPGLVINTNAKEIHFVGTSVGGSAPGSALARAMITSVDEGAGAEASGKLGTDARLNLLVCQSGKADLGRCSVAVDPKSFGYGTIVGRD